MPILLMYQQSVVALDTIVLDVFTSITFFNCNPPDLKLVPVSRTVESNRIVDENVAIFTHTVPMDYMLPGIPPTGKLIEVPFVVIVTFRGDKLISEHLYWDQASVMVQAGLLDPKGLPVSGVEQARKIMDPSLPCNLLLPSWKDSENKPIH